MKIVTDVQIVAQMLHAELIATGATGFATEIPVTPATINFGNSIRKSYYIVSSFFLKKRTSNCN